MQVGRETFRVCRELMDGVVLVNNAAISGAIRDVYSETRTILEPAGALAVAGAWAYLERHGLKVSCSGFHYRDTGPILILQIHARHRFSC